MMTVKVEFSINTVEVNYLYTHLNAAQFVCVRQQTNLVQRRQFQHRTNHRPTIPRNIEGSRTGKTIRRSRYSSVF